MTTDPRAALDRLIAALEAHLITVSSRRGEADPVVVSAYQALADAFQIYDDSLYAAYDEVTPFVLYEEGSEDDEFDDDDEEDEDDDLDDEDDEDDDALEDDEDDLDDGTIEGIDPGNRVGAPGASSL